VAAQWYDKRLCDSVLKANRPLLLRCGNNATPSGLKAFQAFRTANRPLHPFLLRNFVLRWPELKNQFGMVLRLSAEAMKRREVITLLSSAATWPLVARAQPTPRRPIVAFVHAVIAPAEMAGPDLFLRLRAPLCMVCATSVGLRGNDCHR
jgi:hypothetical protein